jgi:hypothetical protein
MLLTKEVLVGVSGKTIKHYESLGYILPKKKNVNGIFQVPHDTKILIKTEHLLKNSEVQVDVLCDHCKINIVSKRYVDYLNERKKSGKDTCNNCRIINTKNTVLKKYGVGNLFQLDWVKEKTKQTNLEKYGVEYSSQCPEIYEKIKQTNLKRFGFKYASQSPEIKEKVSGENNVNWKGGISSERNKIWRTLDYKQWRKSVFERDNYTCQCCGDNKGGNLQAHHKYNFSEYLELRFEIDNGITLCDKCHDFRNIGSFHHKYGTRNNTPEQLEQYINDYKNNIAYNNNDKRQGEVI